MNIATVLISLTPELWGLLIVSYLVLGFAADVLIQALFGLRETPHRLEYWTIFLWPLVAFTLGCMIISLFVGDLIADRAKEIQDRQMKKGGREL